MIHVAFLRGVNNIGRTSRVSMADLRALFEGLGFRDVRTVRNSGNVVFTTAARSARALQGRIEEALAAEVAELTTALGEAHVELRVWKKSAEGRLAPSRTSR